MSLLSTAQNRQLKRVVDAGRLELIEARRVKEILRPGQATGNVQPAAMSGSARQGILKGAATPAVRGIPRLARQNSFAVYLPEELKTPNPNSFGL